MNIKLVIFDFDGTLLDTRETIVAAKQETMRLLNLPVADEETCASTIGLSAKTGFQKTFPNLTEEKLQECVLTYRRVFEEKKVQTPPKLFPGVYELLDALKEKGFTTTIATSRNTESLHEFLGKLDLKKYFSYALGGDDTTLLKPNPDPVLKTLDDLSFSAEETLVVGDMPMDIQMAKSAGVYALGVTYGNGTKEQLLRVGADATADSLDEVLPWILN